MEKLNIAEILRYCPKGMELDCVMYDGLEFDRVDERSSPNYSIVCRVKTESGQYNFHTFTKYGSYTKESYSKCVIFPKGKTTWEGFQIPFKDRDVVYIQSLYEYIAIYKKTNCNNLYKHTAICISFNNRLLQNNNILCCEENVRQIRLATEEEKQKLFDTIKANGYKWNAETKTLEKLIEPKFKVGDVIKSICSQIKYKVTDIRDNIYIIHNHSDKFGYHISFKEQDNYELVPNKFDITTLKPFESKVLVRTSNHKKWVAAFYSHYDKDSLLHHCVVGGLWYEQCVPYNGNEHLLDTTKDCDNYYKTWE